MAIGIMSATQEEIEGLVAELGLAPTVVESGRRVYSLGDLWGTPVVLVFSRWGKVAAAATATQLIEGFGVTHLLFSGAAGGVAAGLRAGDIVIARDLYQHDLDARPLFARYEVPLLGVSAIRADAALRQAAVAAARDFLEHDLARDVGTEALAEHGISRPRVVEADVASGDRFFARRQDVDRLRDELPSVACVEMEGAAVAQVCHEYGVPFVVVRTISDSADEHAPLDFPRFARGVAGAYSRGVMKRLLTNRELFPAAALVE